MKVRNRAIGFKRGRPKKSDLKEFEAGVLELLKWAENQTRTEGMV